MKINTVLEVDADELTDKEWRQLFKRMAFFDADRNEVTCWRIVKGGVILPRGAWSLLPDHIRYYDDRREPRGETFKFERELDFQGHDKSFEGQKTALLAMIKNEQGLVIAQPGWGKTNVALAFAAQVGTPTLVLVHTTDLYDQWLGNLAGAVPDAKVGTIKGSRWTHGDITIAMVQTVTQDMPRFQKIVSKYGAIIADEAHHAPAESWERIFNASPCRWRFGFTATDSRADGLEQLMSLLIGPVIFRQRFVSKVPVKVIKLRSDWKVPYRGHYDWTNLLAQLVAAPERNKMIAERAMTQVKKGHSTLVLSRRVEHLENLRAFMPEGEHIKILTGKVPRPTRLKILDDFRAGKVKLLLSTQLMDEGADVPILSRVFLTFPGKHDGRIIQQVGRALREHDDKTGAIIFDVVDDRISVLRRQWEERKATYHKLKIQVKKNKGEQEVPNVSQARHKREVADRIRKRLGSSRSRH